MAHVITRHLSCPLCEMRFDAQVHVGERPEGFDADFRPRCAGVDPLPERIHSCPGCRYTARRRGFHGELTDEDLYLDEDESWLPFAVVPRGPPDPEEARWLRGRLAGGEHLAQLSGLEAAPAGAARYVVGARCHGYLHEGDPLGAADLYLRGAWCARAQAAAPLERRCLEAAASRLELAFELELIEDEWRLGSTYLLGELRRRLGEHPRAVELFDRICSEPDFEDEEAAAWAALAARQQGLAMVQSSVNAVLDPAVPLPPRA